jgi:hypothetical protein
MTVVIPRGKTVQTWSDTTNRTPLPCSTKTCICILSCTGHSRSRLTRQLGVVCTKIQSSWEAVKHTIPQVPTVSPWTRSCTYGPSLIWYICMWKRIRSRASRSSVYPIGRHVHACEHLIQLFIETKILFLNALSCDLFIKRGKNLFEVVVVH